MSPALLKQEALKLPKSQRLKLASLLLESAPAERAIPSYQEIEKRADDASERVKMIPAHESKARIDRLMARIKGERQER